MKVKVEHISISAAIRQEIQYIIQSYSSYLSHKTGSFYNSFPNNFLLNFSVKEKLHLNPRRYSFIIHLLLETLFPICFKL